VWKEKQGDAKSILQKPIEQKIELEGKREKLLQAHVYEKL
jgi:hypothetical protein